MIYLFTNITDSSADPRVLRINDIPNRGHHVEVFPGETVDLEILSNRNQICQSHHLKSWVAQGFATVDTLGTDPDDDCRLWVTGIDIGDVTIGEINIEEPILQSVEVGGIETTLTGTQIGTTVGMDVQPILPNTPLITCVDVNTANSEENFTLPANTRRYMVYVEEEDTDLEIGFISSGNTITVPCGTNYSEKEVDASMLDLYFQTTKAPATVKILSWSVV